MSVQFWEIMKLMKKSSNTWPRITYGKKDGIGLVLGGLISKELHTLSFGDLKTILDGTRGGNPFLQFWFNQCI